MYEISDQIKNNLLNHELLALATTEDLTEIVNFARPGLSCPSCKKIGTLESGNACSGSYRWRCPQRVNTGGCGKTMTQTAIIGIIASAIDPIAWAQTVPDEIRRRINNIDTRVSGMNLQRGLPIEGPSETKT